MSAERYLIVADGGRWVALRCLVTDAKEMLLMEALARLVFGTEARAGLVAGWLDGHLPIDIDPFPGETHVARLLTRLHTEGDFRSTRLTQAAWDFFFEVIVEVAQRLDRPGGPFSNRCTKVAHQQVDRLRELAALRRHDHYHYCNGCGREQGCSMDCVAQDDPQCREKNAPVKRLGGTIGFCDECESSQHPCPQAESAG